MIGISDSPKSSDVDPSSLPLEDLGTSKDEGDFEEADSTSLVESQDSSPKKKNVKGVKKTPNNRRGYCHVKDDWFIKVDSNGDNVNSYLRPVLNNPNKVFCAADHSYIQCKWRGFAAVQV